MSYQFNYTLPPLTPPLPKPDPNAPMYAAEDGMVASLSSQECIFQLKRTGESHIMTFQVLQSMDQCREFRTLDEHAARIQSIIPALANKRDDVKRVLENLVQRGLLVSTESFVEQLRAAPRAQAPLRAVFIRACDRPEQLAHLLTSLTEYERRFRAGRRYVLLDDSALQANVNEQRDQLREFARNTGCKVNYIGHTERTKIIEKFGKALPHAKSAAMALFSREAQTRGHGFGGGRSKNIALLLSAGSRMILLDDDLRLPLRRPESVSSGLNPDPNSLARVHFHANIEESLSSGLEIAQDPFELNLATCGQALGSLADYSLDRAALRGLNLSRVDIFRGEPYIVATQLGSYGSSRTSSGLWLYQLDAESRKEFWQDRNQYLRNVEVQHIWYSVTQARVIETGGFTPFSMDNSQLLPCTNSVGRGEDNLHGALIRYCHPNGLTLELPEAVGHVQETARKRSQYTMVARVPVVNNFLRDFCDTAVRPVQGGGSRTAIAFPG